MSRFLKSKKKAFVIISLILISLCVSCALLLILVTYFVTDRAAPPLHTPATCIEKPYLSKLFEDSELGIAFRYPESLQVVTDQIRESYLHDTDAMKTIFYASDLIEDGNISRLGSVSLLSSYQAIPSDLAKSDTSQEAARKLIDILSMPLVRDYPREIGGHEGWVIQFSVMTSRGEELILAQGIISVEDHRRIYYLTFSAPSKDWEATYECMWEAILDSVSFETFGRLGDGIPGTAPIPSSTTSPQEFVLPIVSEETPYNNLVCSSAVMPEATCVLQGVYRLDDDRVIVSVALRNNSTEEARCVNLSGLYGPKKKEWWYHFPRPMLIAGRNRYEPTHQSAGMVLVGPYESLMGKGSPIGADQYTLVMLFEGIPKEITEVRFDTPDCGTFPPQEIIEIPQNNTSMIVDTDYSDLRFRLDSVERDGELIRINYTILVGSNQPYMIGKVRTLPNESPWPESFIATKELEGNWQHGKYVPYEERSEPSGFYWVARDQNGDPMATIIEEGQMISEDTPFYVYYEAPPEGTTNVWIWMDHSQPFLNIVLP